MTKGYKSTEFWLSLVAIMTGAILSSGAIENNTVLQGLGLVATALSALGYAGARAITKSGEAKANAAEHTSRAVVESLLKKNSWSRWTK